MERRRRAVELMQRGESPTVIARILGVGRTSPYRWLGMAKGSPDSLSARPHPGPRPRLTDEQVGPLEGLQLEGAEAHGWHNDLWTARRVAEVIRRRFGLDYHVEHVRKLIRRRLHWSSQRPRRQAKQRNMRGSPTDGVRTSPGSSPRPRIGGRTSCPSTSRASNSIRSSAAPTPRGV